MDRFKHQHSPEVSGYLAKTGRIPSRRKKFFFRLSGSFLSRHRSQHAKPSWSMNIAGGSVLHHARYGLALVFKKGYTVLYAKNEDDYKKWFNALKTACNHVLSQYYFIKQRIGVGGFASVRLGMDKETKQLVAIKTIKKGEKSPSFLRREIDILKVIDHPNVVDTLDIFETDREFHVVMEYMKGGMLSPTGNNKSLYSEGDVRIIMRNILEGLSYLHSQGVVHRDLKPENILLTEYGGTDVKVADFGLSKFYDADTLMGTLIGTPEFVAPELVQNEKYGVEVDLWAIGMIMYNMLTGLLPFTEDEVLDIYKRGDVIICFPPKLWNRVSPEAQRLVRQLLCLDVSKRLTAVGAIHHDWFINDSHSMQQKEKSAKPTSMRSIAFAIIFAFRISQRSGFAIVGDDGPVELESASSLASISSGFSCFNSEWEFVADDFSGETQSYRELDSIVTTRTSLMMVPNSKSKEKLFKELSNKMRNPNYLAANTQDRKILGLGDERSMKTLPTQFYEVEPVSPPVRSSSQRAMSSRSNRMMSSFAKKLPPRTFTFTEFKTKGINRQDSSKFGDAMSTSSGEVISDTISKDVPTTAKTGVHPKSLKKAKEWILHAFSKRKGNAKTKK